MAFGGSSTCGSWGNGNRDAENGYGRKWTQHAGSWLWVNRRDELRSIRQSTHSGAHQAACLARGSDGTDCAACLDSAVPPPAGAAHSTDVSAAGTSATDCKTTGLATTSLRRHWRMPWWHLRTTCSAVSPSALMVRPWRARSNTG